MHFGLGWRWVAVGICFSLDEREGRITKHVIVSQFEFLKITISISIFWITFFTPRPRGFGSSYQTLFLFRLSKTSPLQSMLFLAGKDGVITFWDMLTCTQLETIPAHERPVNTLMLCGSTLFSGSSDKFVVTWNVSDIVGNLTDEDTSPNIEEEKSGSSCCCVQ